MATPANSKSRLKPRIASTVTTASRTSTSRVKSHCFFVGNCIGKRNHKAFVFFLFFGFLKSVFGFLCSLFTTIHILVTCEVYKYPNIAWNLLTLLFLLQITLLFKRWRPSSPISKYLFAGLAILGIGFLFRINNFDYAYCKHFALHSVNFILYCLPLFFFYVHLRTQAILIYRDVQ